MRSRLTPVLVLLACALAAPAPAAVSAAPAAPRFADGFEGGLRAWKVQARPDGIAVVRRRARSGRRAARFEVRPGRNEPRTGDQRSEVYVDSPHFRAGTTMYVRDSIRLAPGFSDSSHFRSWRMVQQLHEVGIICPPGIAVFVDPGPRLGIRSGTSRPSFWRGPVIRRDRWYRLTYAVHLSARPQKGWVQVWLDGRRQRLENGRTRMYGTTLKAASAFLKVGMYRSPFFRDTSTVYHDSVSVTPARAQRARRSSSRAAPAAGIVNR